MAPSAWILLALASAVVLGAYDVTKKLAVHDSSARVVLFQGGVAGLILLLALCTAAQSGLLGSSFRLLPLTGNEHLFVLIKACIVTASWACSFVAIRHLPLSLAVPVRASSPLFTLIGAVILFGESLRLLQLLGVASIFAGYLGLARVGQKEGISFVANRYLLLLVAGTLIGAASGLYDKHLIAGRRIPPTTLQFWFSFYNALILTTSVAAWVLLRRDRLASFVRLRPLALGVGVLLVVADQFYFRALVEEGALVSVISMVRRSNVLVSFAVGGILLRESFLRQKAWMLALVMAGIFLLLV